ncbi:MAG TPA: CD225/dispanin family protein [Actinomycetales bacterium]|jgi:hypothetical protein
MSDYGTPPPPPPPGYGYGAAPQGQPAGPPPPNYLVQSILATLFCCLPLGIASIVFAAQVNGKHAMGDYAGAVESSAKAKKFAIWSVIAFFIVVVLYVILAVVLNVGLSGSRTGTDF